MAYIVDSDWLIDYLANDEEATQVVEGLADEGFSISIITYMEVYEGLEAGRYEDDATAKFEDILSEAPLLQISPEVARRCARLRHHLRTEGKRVNQRSLDLILAATALEHGLTLVTRNTEDYRDIPGLDLYDVAGSAKA